MRFLIVLAGVALLGCGPAATTTTSTTTTSVTAAGAGPGMGGVAPLLVAGLDVSCNAEHESVCDEKGCRAQTDGMTHVAFSYDGGTGHGTFCIGEGCNPMFLAPLPAAHPAGAGDDIMATIVIPGAADSTAPETGPYADGIAVLKQDGSLFQVIRNGVSVWTGACVGATQH